MFIGPEVDDRWFDGYLASRDRAVRLAITTAGRDDPIGVVYLTDIQRVNRSAELGIMIGERDVWSRGIGTAAVRSILAHGFNDLNLHRIHLSVLVENVRATRMYEKLGFCREGRLKSAIYKQTVYHDVILMAILEPEYRSLMSTSPDSTNEGGT